MGRLAASDLGNAMAFLASASTGTQPDPIPAATLRALRDFIGADECEYFELRREDRAVVAASQSDSWQSAPGSEEAMHVHGAQNPIGWRRWGPADGAMRLSAMIGGRDLKRLEFYQLWMRPNHLRDTLKVWLWSSPESAACVQLWRHGATFGQREQDLLGAVHRGLIRLRAEALTAPASPPDTDRVLTRREAEVLLLACRGVSDDGIAEELGISTGTVGKHLQHAYEKLGAHSRSEALWLLTRLGLAATSRPRGTRGSSDTPTP